MREPSIRTSRLAIAGGLVGAIALAGGGFLLGRSSSPDASPTAVPAPPPVAAPVEISAPPLLARADLIALGNAAADAYVSGASANAEGEQMAGRRFDLVLPFGCAGPSGEEGSRSSLRWNYDESGQRLSVSVSPVRWELAEWDLIAAQEPGLEGFWVERPWSLGESCPKRNASAGLGSEPVTLPGQTLAIAEALPPGRLRERPYEVVKRVAPDAFSAAQGFRLRLRGRLTSLPGGQVVRCVQPAGSEQRPLCLIGVTFEELRIENPLDGEALGVFPMRSVADDRPRNSLSALR